MADTDKAVATQLRNIETRSGKSVEELLALIRDSGLVKHSEVVAMLKTQLGMGHGDANLMAHQAKAAASPPPPAAADPLDTLYVGAKAALRPIHERLLSAMEAWGGYEVAPKQKYVSYRRKKQFAMIGPATNTRVELGLNVKELAASPRLERLPPGEMCQYKLRLAAETEVDAEVIACLRAAYEAAG